MPEPQGDQSIDEAILRQLLADTGPGAMHNKTSTGLIFTQGPIDFVFTGSGIKYVAGFPIAGTITGLNILHDDVSAYKLTNFSISVQEALSIWTAVLVGNTLFLAYFGGIAAYLASERRLPISEAEGAKRDADYRRSGISGGGQASLGRTGRYHPSGQHDALHDSERRTPDQRTRARGGIRWRHLKNCSRDREDRS